MVAVDLPLAPWTGASASARGGKCAGSAPGASASGPADEGKGNGAGPAQGYLASIGLTQLLSPTVEQGKGKGSSASDGSFLGQGVGSPAVFFFFASKGKRRAEEALFS